MYQTSAALIEKQKEFWDEDLSMPGDYFSDLLTVDLSELSLDDSIINSYSSDQENLKKINSYAEEIDKGTLFPPLLINQKYEVVDGYHRYLALKKLNKKQSLAIMIIEVER